MKSALKKQIEEMTDDEIGELLRRDYTRRLVQYRMLDDFHRKKYSTNYDAFEKSDIIQKQNYSFEVESDAQEWELAIDGIRTMEKKRREIAGGD